jgi:hypothetical protein
MRSIGQPFSVWNAAPMCEAYSIQERAHNILAQRIKYRQLIMIDDMRDQVDRTVRTAGGFRWSEDMGWLEHEYDIP